ncbi:AMP-binding acetyl-CoA synthetase [Gammaproteobacteria bacterium 45_16_T64]|nr:AMP-binding acetyl-CoA synthetase [Gammaproteobacteria bacterium 45_16_T64]
MTASADINVKGSTVVKTGTPLPLERFYYWERNHPNKICFTQPVGDGEIIDYTWGEIGNQIRRMAGYLKSIGVEEGTPVGILSKNCAHWIMSDLAIWMAGGVSVPLYPTLAPETIQQIIEHSNTKILFVGKLDGWDDMKSGIPSDVTCLSYPLSPTTDYDTWNDVIANSAPVTENPTRTHEELATIIYTSGTTGMPKGVMHNFASLAAGASEASNIYEVTSNDRILSYLPLSHVAERMCVELVTIYQGVRVYFAESLDTFAYDLQRARPTIFFAVPRIWAKFQSGVFAKMPEKKLNRLLKVPILSGIVKKKIKTQLGLVDTRFCLSGAAPIPNSLLEWYGKLGLEILEVYGMTENMGYSHSTRSGKSRVGFVGQPNPGVDVILGDGNEVLVKSPATMIGYYKEPEKTAETLDDEGYIHTGDVGHIDADGSLKITGRIKEIFKTSKGKYVAPFPIEGKMLACSNIEQICVVGAGMPQPMALLMLSEADREHLAAGKSRDEIQQNIEGILRAVNKVVDPHEKLRTAVVVKDDWTVENGFMTPTLKIKRNVLEAHYQDNFETWFDAKIEVQWEQ